jgi:hypothetical protein
MPAEVIERVPQLADQGNAPEGLSFADRTGIDPHAGDGENDADWDPDIEGDDDEVPLLADDIAGVIDPDENDSGDENVAGNEDENDENENENLSEDENDENENKNDENENEIDENETENENENENLQNINETDENENRQNRQNENENENENEEHATAGDETEDKIADTAEDHADNAEATTNQKYGSRDTNHNLSPRKPRNYSHIHATLEGIALTQHAIERGLKLFGEAGTHAVLQELKQLHDRNVVEPKTFHDLSCKERRDSLRYLMFLKKKSTGIIKGRGCANGDENSVTTLQRRTRAPPPPPSPSNRYCCCVPSTRRRGGTSPPSTFPAPSCKQTWTTRCTWYWRARWPSYWSSSTRNYTEHMCK